jgi:hypothetical protein
VATSGYSAITTLDDGYSQLRETGSRLEDPGVCRRKRSGDSIQKQQKPKAVDDVPATFFNIN